MIRKNLILIGLVACLCIAGCGGPDEATQYVIDKIDSIGIVELAEESDIVSIYEKYNTLTDKQKENVPNYHVLLSALDEIEELKRAEKAEVKEKAETEEKAELNTIPDSKNGDDSTYKKETIEFDNENWPKDGIASLIPPISTEDLKMTYFNDHTLSFDAAIDSLDTYYQYLEIVKEWGYIKNASDTLDDKGTYIASNDDGCKYGIYYYESGNKLMISGYLSVPIGYEYADSQVIDKLESVDKSEDEVEKNNEKEKEDVTSGVVNPDLKAFLDEYEKFMDEYIAFMEKYNKNPNDINIMNDYSKLLQEYAVYMDKLDKYDSDNMSDVDAAYYLEVTTRVATKMTKAAQRMN